MSEQSPEMLAALQALLAQAQQQLAAVAVGIAITLLVF